MAAPLLIWAACTVALQPALGQCGGGVTHAEAAVKPAACYGKATPSGAASAAEESRAGSSLGRINLRQYFDSLEPDASLWYQHVQTLANPAFKGRAPGTWGSKLAAEYIEHYFSEYGLKPPFACGAGVDSQTAPDSGKGYRQSFALGESAGGCGTTCTSSLAQNNPDFAKTRTENVAGALPGKGKLKDEWIVIGGHYDAPGIAPRSSPCYSGGKALLGADDNASGTAAVLVLAKRLSEAYAADENDADMRSIMFVAFAAEETGLNGSRYFVEHPPVPLDKVHAMLNLDMVGRMRQDNLWVSGVGTAARFGDLLDPLLRESGLHAITEPGGAGSDHVSFWDAGVPAIFLMTGAHRELHSPADTADTMNPEGAIKVIDLSEKIAMLLSKDTSRLAFVAQGSAMTSGCSEGMSAMANADESPETGGAPSCGGAQASGDAQSTPSSPVSLPDTLAGRRAAGFFEAFNSGSDEKIREYDLENVAASSLAKRPMEDRIARTNEIRRDWGTLTPTRVVEASATEIAIEARSSNTGGSITMTFQLEEEPPHGLLGVSFAGAVWRRAPVGPAQPIGAELRNDTIKQIADTLRDEYVYPEIGQRMADVLAKYVSEGRYDALTDAADLAQRLTMDLFAVCKDHHLTVQPNTGSACAPACGSSHAAGDSGGDCGFRKTEILPGDIGYIKLDMFQSGERAQEAAAAALASVADCNALIFDLRENVGGSPEMIQFISSYLFDKPTHLNSFYDRLNNKVSETWTFETIPGKRFRSNLPVYVLTSHFTGSAAEEFTYNLKNLKRATIVGETTVGAAHEVTGRTINEQFVLMVPYQRACNPITNTNWEGVGVSPDIRTAASEALDAACNDAAAKTRNP